MISFSESHGGSVTRPQGLKAVGHPENPVSGEPTGLEMDGLLNPYALAFFSKLSLPSSLGLEEGSF
jgi:hypothetical protein